MVRSLNSGVAALKSHQTRLDVIGNNIANVNTYGFKGSRVTFRDLYYQSTKGAAAPGSGGGINPSQIGYGSTMGSIDVMHGQAALTTTGNPLDLAISGEGFFQVMDGEGNKYYTRAGMLDIDSAGNLIDTNGNFILGVNGKAVGKGAGSQKITLSIPSVDPAAAKAEEKFNNGLITVKASTNTAEGNVGFSITASDKLDIGEKARASIKSGSIAIQLNGNMTFNSLQDVEDAIHDAINTAMKNQGETGHPAGKFTLSMSDELKTVFNGGLTGFEVCATTANPEKDTGSGKFIKTGTTDDGGISVTDVGATFGGIDKGTKLTVVKGTYTEPDPTDPTATVTKDKYTVTLGSYTYDIKASNLADSNDIKTLEAGKPIRLTNGTNSSDYISLTLPSAIVTEIKTGTFTGTPATLTTSVEVKASTKTGAAPTDGIVATIPGKAAGLGQNFKLSGGTEGGPQTVKDLSSIAIGADGVITGVHGILGELELGRIDLATFDNPKGLAEVGDTYFQATENSGEANPNKIGEGGTGSVVQSMLEMSSVDISEEFTNMITTQRGFQANSRIVTVTDTMLEELINLKR